MICFELYLNGERLCRAGKEDMTVLTSILSYVASTGKEEELLLTVSGLLTSSEGHVHSSWLQAHDVQVGDEVTIKIVAADTADDPSSETI